MAGDTGQTADGGVPRRPPAVSATPPRGCTGPGSSKYHRKRQLPPIVPPTVHLLTLVLEGKAGRFLTVHRPFWAVYTRFLTLHSPPLTVSTILLKILWTSGTIALTTAVTVVLSAEGIPSIAARRHSEPAVCGPPERRSLNHRQFPRFWYQVFFKKKAY